MKTEQAMASFAALSQPTRLAAFKLLVRHEPEGLPAGEIATLLDVPHNTLSAHLSVLARAELVLSQRQSRSIIYRANLDAIQAVIQFLVNDCCVADSVTCTPLESTLSFCQPQQKKPENL